MKLAKNLRSKDLDSIAEAIHDFPTPRTIVCSKTV